MIAGSTNISGSTVLAVLLILEINHPRHLRHFGRISGPNVITKCIWSVDFWRKINLMEINRNLQFTHNVDQNMVKFKGIWNFIYVIIGIF